MGLRETQCIMHYVAERLLKRQRIIRYRYFVGWRSNLESYLSILRQRHESVTYTFHEFPKVPGLTLDRKHRASQSGDGCEVCEHRVEVFNLCPQ